MDKRQVLDAIGQGDTRSSGTRTQSGNIVFATTTLAMDINDLVVRASTAAGAFTITLPSITEATGRIYSICLVTDNGDLTVQDKGDDTNFTDLTFDTAEDYAVLYSDGFQWRNLVSDTAT